MSHYTPPRLCFADRDFNLSIGFESESPLFDPNELGICPTSFSTACWTGWYATYELIARHLHLKTLHVYAAAQELPAIEHCFPEQLSDGTSLYSDVGLSLRFTGTLRATPPSLSRFDSPLFSVGPFECYELHFREGVFIRASNQTYRIVGDSDTTTSITPSTQLVCPDAPTPFD